MIDRCITGTEEFKAWYAAVTAEATRRGVVHLLGRPTDHLSGFQFGTSPEDEVTESVRLD